MGLADGKPSSMAGFKEEQRAKLAEVASQLNPNHLSGSQVISALLSSGLSKLDADLIADCINMHKACTWQNDEDPKSGGLEAANKFLDDNKLGVRVEMSPARFGKFIWETKINR